MLSVNWKKNITSTLAHYLLEIMLLINTQVAGFIRYLPPYAGICSAVYICLVAWVRMLARLVLCKSTFQLVYLLCSLHKLSLAKLKESIHRPEMYRLPWSRRHGGWGPWRSGPRPPCCWPAAGVAMKEGDEGRSHMGGAQGPAPPNPPLAPLIPSNTL